MGPIETMTTTSMSRTGPIRASFLAFALTALIGLAALCVVDLAAARPVLAAPTQTTAVVTNTCTQVPPPGVICIASTTIPPAVTNSILLSPPFFNAVTSEGTKVCGYAPTSQIFTTWVSAQGTQAGPTLQADANGCVDVSIRYIGGTQFETYLGRGQWSQPYTLAPGTNYLDLSGTGASGGVLNTNVEFNLGHVAGLGNAASIKGKPVSWLTWTIIAAILIDLLLFIAGTALMWMSRRGSPGGLPAAGTKDDEDEESESTGGIGDEGEESWEGQPPMPELPKPR
jgi:hypothetical protein